MKKVLHQIKPQLLILTETEIWPCLIHYTKKMGCKILLINGRMTENSYRMYRKFDFIFRECISEIDVISVQSEIDKKRYSFFKEQEVVLSGNLKFALSVPSLDLDKIKKDWKVSSDFVITFGSSRPGEEELVIELHKFLKVKDIKHQIILAPRHLTRLEEIENLLIDNKINYSIFSEKSDGFDLLLIDKMGELLKAYSISDIAVIGGSFYDFGGHNPLEAAYFGKPILMGEYHSSCQKTVETLLKNKAIKILDKEQLCDFVKYLYESPEARKEMGRRAKKIMQRNCYSFEKTLQLIEEYLLN